MTANRFPNTFSSNYPVRHNKREKKVLETSLNSARLDVADTFTNFPKYSKTNGYSDPTGATGDTNLMNTSRASYEYHIKGTQTILSPVWSLNGLNIAMDQTAADGVELTNGITARCAQSFVVGTDFAFYCEASLTPADVSGIADGCFGFRKAEAYQALVDDYNDGAWLNIAAGNVVAETILANAATTTSGTLTTTADATAVTLRVEVNLAGQAKFLVNGTDYTGSVTPFTFAAGAVLVPFMFHLQDTDLNDTCYVTSWKCGRLYR